MRDDTYERIQMAQYSYDMTGYCPEKGRSHDSRPCCICGKTIFNDGTRPAHDSTAEHTK